MSIFKAIASVITTACNVVIKLLSSVERGANSLDELAQAGEIKARNFKDLVSMNDEAEFEKRKAEINVSRVEQGLAPIDAKSTQEKIKEKEEEDAAAKAERIAKVKAAQAQLDI